MAACVAACTAKGIAAGGAGGRNGEIVEAWIPECGVVALLARGEGIGGRKRVRIGMKYAGWRVAMGGRLSAGLSRVRVDLEELAIEDERDEAGRLWSTSPVTYNAYESMKYKNGAPLIVDNGVNKVATDGSIESAAVEASSNAARVSNSAGMERLNGSVSTNGRTYSNGASGLPTNGGARAALNSVNDMKVISKVESIEKEDPWFKKGNIQNVKVTNFFLDCDDRRVFSTGTGREIESRRGV